MTQKRGDITLPGTLLTILLIREFQFMNTGLKNYVVALCMQYKLYIILMCCLCLAGAVFDIAVTYKIKEIIDEIASNTNAKLGFLLVLFAFYKLMHHGAYFFFRLLDVRYKPMILEQTVCDIYKKTVGHSLHWFDSHMSGEISNKISDFQNSILTISTHMFYALVNIATICISVVFLMCIHYLTALVLLAFIAIYTPILALLMKKQIQLQEHYTNSRQRTIGIINDSLANIFGIKIIGNILTEFKLKLAPAISNWKSWERKTRKFDAFFIDNADTIIVTVMSVGQIYLLAQLFKAGYITAGSFTFVAIITLNIHRELDNFLQTVLFNINPSIAQLRSSYSFVSSKYDVVDEEGAVKLAKVSGKISYNNVSFSYGRSSKQVLKDFNLEIQPGEKLGLVGTSGAGKTTLVKCFLRYFDVNSGAVYIDDHKISEVTQETLRKNVSIIPQDIAMFHRSIKENLKLAKYNATDKEIIAACKKARIHSDIMEMDDGYDTIVGERGVKLSGGQRQRVAIARAILKNAPILILDEATSNLDTPTEALIQESINEVLENNKSTVIAIAHRLSTLKHMDRIIVLRNGKIIEEGTHNSLIRKKDGAYKKLWDMQII